MWNCRGGEEKVINFIQNAKNPSHPAMFKMEEIVTSNILQIPKTAFPDLVCWCCWIIGRKISSSGEEESRGGAREDFEVTTGQVIAPCSSRTFLMGLHMSGACVCDGIDGFIKEEFLLEPPGLDLRSAQCKTGNTHLSPNVPNQHNF